MAIPNYLCDFVSKDFSNIGLFIFRLHVRVVKSTLIIGTPAVIGTLIVVVVVVVIGSSYTHKWRSWRGVLRIEVLCNFSGFISHRGEDHFLHFFRGTIAHEDDIFNMCWWIESWPTILGEFEDRSKDQLRVVPDLLIFLQRVYEVILGVAHNLTDRWHLLSEIFHWFIDVVITKSEEILFHDSLNELRL